MYKRRHNAIHLVYTSYTGQLPTAHAFPIQLTSSGRMSKDFGSNGLRIGVLVSQHNPDLIKSFGVSNILMKVSSPAVCLAELFLEQADVEV